MIMKHGHELLCDCGQPLNEQGVCMSCHPPEEEDEELLERENGDPRPLNLDLEGERAYEPDLNCEEPMFYEEFDE